MIQIEYDNGDLFENGAHWFVCPVNCVGVMGKGLALEFKKRFPHLETMYIMALERGDLAIGKSKYVISDGQGIVLFPTKWHWKNPSQYYMVNDAFRSMISSHLMYNRAWPETYAMPKVGCGLGGLDWGVVKSNLIEIVNTDTYEYATGHITVYE